MHSRIVVENTSFNSQRHLLLARIYRPEAEGKYPAVVLCLGYTGNQKFNDLCEELALNGIVALMFFYHGTWGSDGDFRVQYLVHGTIDAVMYLRSLDYVDPERIGLVSHSMGAVPLTQALATDGSIKTGVLMAPVSATNGWDLDEVQKLLIPGFMHMAAGKLSGLTVESPKKGLALFAKEYNPIPAVKKIHVPLLVISGSKDTVTKPEDCRMLFENANEPKKWVSIEEAEHNFYEHRYPLMKEAINWFNKHLKST